MRNNCTVRIIKTQLNYFKNVQHGEIKYINYSNAENKACIDKNDILGIYGQNGSGKTAMVEALDILQHILMGIEINYDEYEGLIDENGKTSMITTFFIDYDDKCYKAEYKFNLMKSDRKIQISEEELCYWRKGVNWKTERKIYLSNPFYNNDSILTDNNKIIVSEDIKHFKDFPFLNSIQNLAIYCSQKNISILFNNVTAQNIETATLSDNIEIEILYNVIYALYNFGRLYFHVVKVNQLSDINNKAVLPMNIHNECGDYIMQGCLPMFLNGKANIDEYMYTELCNAIDVINIALKSIIPNLQIEIVKVNEEIVEDGHKIIQINVYSVRDNKRFLTKYESEGIKRIISLLNYLIAFYNSPKICLVVDELDSGIFEYLLGELLGILKDEAKGQLIFTSHNLRVLEKLDNSNIICTTVNPINRYIRLQGVEKNNNKRDFYIRSIVIGGQKEDIYDDTDLQAIGYAFRKARKKDNMLKLNLSDYMKNLLSNDNK